MVVLKFGGTSVADVPSIRRVAGIIAAERPPRALGDLPIQLVARPSGGRTLAFVVDARQTATAMSRLHDRFFGAAARQPSALRPVVQA